MASENIESIRARVARKEANAARKIRRNVAKGVTDLPGSKFDPRTDKDVTKMRTRDLQAYERRLDSFTSRSTQFEAGSRGAPLPRQKWQAYKQSENAVRDAFNAALDPLRNIPLPGPGDETIGIRQDKVRTKHPTAANIGYVPPERKPFNVKDVDALDKLTKSNRKRMTKRWKGDEYKRAQNELMQMVSVFEDDALNKSVVGMTKGQFDVLWNMTGFADKMSITYHHYQKKYTPKQQMPQELIDTELAQAKELITWVKQLDL